MAIVPTFQGHCDSTQSMNPMMMGIHRFWMEIHILETNGIPLRYHMYGTMADHPTLWNQSPHVRIPGPVLKRNPPSRGATDPFTNWSGRAFNVSPYFDANPGKISRKATDFWWISMVSCTSSTPPSTRHHSSVNDAFAGVGVERAVWQAASWVGWILSGCIAMFPSENYHWMSTVYTI